MTTSTSHHMDAVRKILILAVSFVGLFASLYLWWAYTSPSRPLVCLRTGCDVVRASSYAHLWGVPLPAFGAAMYSVLVLFAFAETLGGKALLRILRSITLLIAAAGFVVSAVLTGIETFILHAWCVWCMVSAVSTTLILLFAVWRVARSSQPPEPAAALRSLRCQFSLLLLALTIGIPAFVYLSHSGEFAPPKPVSPATLAARLVRPDSHATGDLQSPVTVVEFGDFECPACSLAQRTVKKELDQYGNRIRYVFRQFPLASIHPQAEKAAEACECAAVQGKFWQAERLFYQKQSNLSVPALEGYAARLGLDTRRFDDCLTSSRMAARVRQDVADGKALGVKGTPTFFVGRQMILGPPNTQQFLELTVRQLLDYGMVKKAAESSIAIRGAHPSPPGAPSGISSEPVPTGSLFGSAVGTGLSGGGALSQFQAQSALACTPEEASGATLSIVRTGEAENLFHEKALFVDVRTAQKFVAGHIPGAINIPVEAVGQEAGRLPKKKTLVFYQGGGPAGSPNDVCAFSEAAARSVLTEGFDKSMVRVYQDGLAGWERAGLPVVKQEPRLRINNR